MVRTIKPDRGGSRKARTKGDSGAGEIKQAAAQPSPTQVRRVAQARAIQHAMVLPEISLWLNYANLNRFFGASYSQTRTAPLTSPNSQRSARTQEAGEFQWEEK